ncbi:MAG: peptidylprolyl isomerase [Bacteroidaceae bacterium]|nr:peptidylprolyl isomerase [Bacteroidaceae bacterium]
MANKVKISTSLGDIVVRLYDETPLHRDNFLKLAREGYFDGTLFHRVIRDFMVQGGDPDSRGAAPGKQLGVGGPGYTIPAEILPQCIHKRGALAAARQGDEVNPERRSSGSQFYIVWGQKYKEGQLAQFGKQLKQQAEQQFFNTLVQQHRKEIMEMRKNRDQAGLMELQNDLVAQAYAMSAEHGPYGLTDEQKTAYQTLGGTPHLDGQYTVFGEVEEGLDVVGKIQEQPTGRGDRPVTDVVMKVTVL